MQRVDAAAYGAPWALILLANPSEAISRPGGAFALCENQSGEGSPRSIRCGAPAHATGNRCIWYGGSLWGAGDL